MQTVAPQISTASIASSAARVPYSRIRELAELAMSMDNVLKLYFGESNIPTPEFIKRAAQKAMRLRAYEDAVRLYEMAIQSLEMKEPVDESGVAAVTNDLRAAKETAGLATG